MSGDIYEDGDFPNAAGQSDEAEIANAAMEDHGAAVTKPTHYAKGAVEPRHLYESAGMARDFYRGNIIKYVFRYADKDGIRDLLKARVYLDFLIAYEKSKVLP